MKNNINNSESFFNETVKPKSYFKKFLKFILKGFSCIVLSLFTGFILSSGYIISKEVLLPKLSNNIEEQSVITSSNSNNTTDSPHNNLKNIIKNTSSSVVTITTVNQQNNLFNIPIQTEGAGSGVIFYKSNSKTYILTNNHVIEGAVQVGVAIDESEPIYASLVGRDSNNDLAIISIDNSDIKKMGIDNIKVAKFASSSIMQEGDTVIAIGNALGEGKTATLGIISSASKDIELDGNSINMLQTTAAINPGNSGGALINSNGEVIGINTAKIASTDVNRIGYSISSDLAMQVIEKIMNNSNPPSLGVYIVDNNSNNYQQETSMGALVMHLIEGGAASKAGILPGDVITSVNETPIFNSKQLIDEIKNYRAGETVKVKILRKDELITIKVKLQENMDTSTSF